MANTPNSITLLGAGLAGSLMSAYLAQHGFQVDIYERREDIRSNTASAGKSINLALSERGLHALSQIGIRQQVLELCIPMRGRMIHTKDGKALYQSYSKDDSKAILSISRKQLNELLLNQAEASNKVRLHFHEKCVHYNTKTGVVTLQNTQNNVTHQVHGEITIGADGAFSGLRTSLVKTPRFNYSQQFLTHGYKELSIAPTAAGGWKMEKNALHIWPRGQFMLIALPNLDGSFTVTLFFPYQGADSFASLNNAEKLIDFFQREFPDALALMPHLKEEFFENPVGDLVTIRCSPWAYQDKAILIGDAAHAIVPFFGQGMNAAFEDCSLLSESISKYHEAKNWQQIFDHFQHRRIQDANAIADMALENYIEMRDHTGNPAWQLRKAVEHKLGKAFPDKYRSRYSLISFSRTPYSIAYKQGLINDRILDELCAGLTIPEKVDMEKAKILIEQYID